jgi:16S rRNA (adenine(1408)-N(1))-methyltransferase
MAEVARRAARAPERGGQPNLLFAVASAERPPDELIGRADEVSAIMPWGSLLRGVLALDPDAACGIAALLRPSGRLVATLSVTNRDRIDVPPLDGDGAAADLARRWASHGLRVDAFDLAGADEVAATGSSWGRRLSVGRSRPIWRLVARAERTERPTDAGRPPR